MLYRHGIIEVADTVHHIETAKDRPDLFYSDSNLIPVSRKGHEEIHTRYKNECMNTVQHELKKYRKKYEEAGDRKKVFGISLTTTYAPFLSQNSKNKEKVGK